MGVLQIKIFIIFLISLSISNGIKFSINNETLDISEHDFPQRVDHFNQDDTKTQDQPFYSISNYFNPDKGSIILVIDSENSCEIRFIDYPWIFSLAKQLQSVVVFSQSRLKNFNNYNLNRSDKESYDFLEYLKIENLEIFTIEQCLEDANALIQFIKINQMFNVKYSTPVVTFGSQLGGTLSVLLKQRFPEIFNASLSLNPTLLINQDYGSSIDEVISKQLFSIDNICKHPIQQLNRDLEESIRNGQLEALSIKQIFQAEALTDKEFLLFIAELWEKSITLGHSLELCKLMNLNVNFHEYLVILQQFSTNFLNIKEYQLSNLQDPKTKYKSARLRWWQDCTQLGIRSYPKKSSPMRSRKLNKAFFKRQCEFLFGEEYSSVMEQYNKTKLNSLTYLRQSSSENNTNLLQKAYAIYYILPQSSLELEKTGITCYNLHCPECSLNIFLNLQADNRISEIQQNIVIELETLIYQMIQPLH